MTAALPSVEVSPTEYNRLTLLFLHATCFQQLERQFVPEEEHPHLDRFWAAYSGTFHVASPMLYVTDDIKRLVARELADSRMAPTEFREAFEAAHGPIGKHELVDNLLQNLVKFTATQKADRKTKRREAIRPYL